MSAPGSSESGSVGAKCPRAKTSMTPCWLRDGEVTEIEIGGEPACVGCAMQISKIRQAGDSTPPAENVILVGGGHPEERLPAYSTPPDESDRAKPIHLETDVVKRIEHFRGLEKDWNSYGAEPIPDAVVDLAHVVVQRMEGGVHQITWACPTNDEGIQLDTESGMGIEVSRYGN